MKLYFTTILSYLFLTSTTVAQNREVIFDEGKDKMFGANEMIFYGIDFSKFRLVNFEKLDHGKRIKYSFFPAWMERFDAKFPEKRMQDVLMLDKVTFKKQPFQSDQFMKNDENTTVSNRPPELNLDSLQTIVNGYQLSEKEGIGLSIIVESFVKSDETGTGYVTFFDINSRKLLYVVRTKGPASGRGMTDHWFEALYRIWGRFVGRVYEEEKALYINQK